MRFFEFSAPSGPTLSVPTSSSGTDVANIQKVLSAFDYNIGPKGIDGTLNPYTSAAIGLAQRDVGLPVTGVPDKELIQKINNALLVEPEVAKLLTTAGPTSPELSKMAPSPTLSNNPDSIMFNRKGSNITTKDPSFNKKVDEVANTLGIQPSVLMRIMKHESGILPWKVNPKSGATGLIQFMPKTAKRLGTSTSALAKMSAIEQMDWVLKYYESVHVKPGMDVGDIYMLTFIPAYGNAPNDSVLGQLGGGRLPGTELSKDSIYRQNSLFDHNKKNYFTVADVKNHINNFA